MPKLNVRKAEANSSPKPGRRTVAAAAVQPVEPAGVPPNNSPADLAEKIKELIRLAQEQGHLTHADISDVLPENELTPEKLDEVFAKLRAHEIEIVDQAEVDNARKPEAEEEEEDNSKSRLDILDDPVRMYLNQMGQIGRAHD